MKRYFKKDMQSMDLDSSNDLPENALKWAAVLNADEEKFS
jgi:hypothetical protein